VIYPYRSLTDAWVSELRMTMVTGEKTSPRGYPTRERRWAHFQIDDVLGISLSLETGRAFRYEIGVLEAMSMLGQFSVPELLSDRVARFADFEDAGVLYGAYGARTHGVLEEVIATLRRDPDSRQAVLTIFDSTRDLGRDRRDIPCTVAVQFLVRNDRDQARAESIKEPGPAEYRFPFPLFGNGRSIPATARSLALNPHKHNARTEFESWARAVLS
jgi:hypothetical protein